ncbi:MAG: GNAT family N-acetyltransferase [Alphaproteobacteria bacterium]
MQVYDIREDDLEGEATRALLTLHLQGMHENTPPEHVFALDLSGLKAPGATVWSAWDGAALAGIGALKELGNGAGEIKSMRTDPRYLRKGIGSALLLHIIAEARRRGLRRLSLETGRGPAFEPALLMYRKHGFIEGEAFAGYKSSDFSRFFHLAL